MMDIPQPSKLAALKRDEAAVDELFRRLLAGDVTLGDLALRYSCTREQVDAVIRGYAQQIGPAGKRPQRPPSPPPIIKSPVAPPGAPRPAPIPKAPVIPLPPRPKPIIKAPVIPPGAPDIPRLCECGREIVGRHRNAKICLVCRGERKAALNRARWAARKASIERRCVVCSVDISGRYHNAKYCFAHSGEANVLAARQYRRRRRALITRARGRLPRPRRCADCPANISHRGPAAKWCESCARLRTRKHGREHMARARRRQAGIEAPRPATIECSCGAVLAVSPIGRVPKACPSCARLEQVQQERDEYNRAKQQQQQ